jgi:hypothetical protein
MHILECWPVLQVMEILAHNLETESSLHRRVDLFFLVDSIAQFSRGLKGNLFIALPLMNLVDQKRRKNI